MRSIQCRHCGHQELINKALLIKIFGGAMTGFGCYAWASYLFSSSYKARLICTALIVGGITIATLSDEIAEFFSKIYRCPICSNNNWEVSSEQLGVNHG